MATLTLNCSGGTFLSYMEPSTDHSSLTEIPTCPDFLRIRTAEAEGWKIGLAALEENFKMDEGGALLEFPSSDVLKYKKINSVTLYYTIAVKATDDPYPIGMDYNNEGTWAQLRDAYQWGKFGEILMPYISNQPLSNITLLNFESVGRMESAQVKKTDLSSAVTGSITSYNRNVDITSQYNATFKGQTARFIIATGNSISVVTDSTTVWEGAYPILAAKLINLAPYDPSAWGYKYIDTSSAYLVVNYDDDVQLPPTPLEPIDEALKSGNAIGFNWRFNAITAATQKSALIQYKKSTDLSWTEITHTGSSTTHTLQNGLTIGEYEWRVKVTNVLDEVSDFSDTNSFTVIGKPVTPIIIPPENCCLTTISWNAAGQEAAEFILMDGDGNVLIHETVATAVTSYKPQMFLKGSYKAMARIKNNSDLWSDYGELEFDIDAAEPDPGNLIAMPFDTEIHLEGTYTSTNVAIVRIDEDGTETVLAMDDHAVDKKVAGGTEYAYVLRSWNTGGYIDTPAKVFDFKFEGAIFSTETEELHLDRSEQKFLTHGEEIERQYAQMRYVGREFAVIERGEYTEQTLSKQFHVTKAQRRILDRMAKEKSLFYRDSRGNAFKAAILSVSYSNYMDNDYIASIRLTRTAADEVIINV